MIKPNWYNTPLMSAFGDDDFSGGGSGVQFLNDDDGADEVVDVDDVDDDEDDDDDSDDDDDDSPPSKKSSASFNQPSFNPEAFAAAITKGLAPVLQQQNKKQLTREEIETQLGKPKISADLIKQLRDPETPVETALAGLAQLLNQQEEYLLKASGLAMEGKVGEISPVIQRLQQHQAQQQEAQFVSSVQQKYPALKGKGKAVSQALKYLMQQGYQPTSTNGVKRDVAKMASQLIRQLDSSFTLKPKSQQQFMRPGAGGGSRGPGPGKSKSKGLISQLFPVS